MTKKLLLIITSFVIVTIGYAQDDIIFFSDSPNGDVLYDASWGYVIAPSYLEMAGNNDKFPVDPEHPFQGAHSLRLHWISKSSGTWGIAVASVGWTGYNFTQYDSIVYWINAPEAIAQIDLPDLSLEDLSNKRSARISLGDYFEGVDNDSSTWQKVMIPISAIQPGVNNCDFTRVKTIFHWQRQTDAIEHIAWIDEIRIIKAGGVVPTPPAAPTGLVAAGHDSRIDLRWKRNVETDLLGYFIYRSAALIGTYTKLTAGAYESHLYSDFFGENDKTYYYYVTAVNDAYQESSPSDTVTASSSQMSDEELLTSVQEAAFRYFYDYGHPVSGLSREVSGSDEVCTSGGTGFGLMAIMIGAERGFVSRDSAATRILKILSFLQDTADRYHGAWSHWINGETGATIPFSPKDDGGDIVETAYLIQGILTIRQYFDQNNAVENEIRTRAMQLWQEVEWDWYRRTPDGTTIYWHWSPNYEWQMNFPITGFNEAMIVYLLAIASPTHAVPASLYYDGWAGSGSYASGGTYYGHKIWVGQPYGGPLFFTHYSFLGFDPRDKSDKYCNYFDNNRNISLVHRDYCIDNPFHHTGYDSLVWGLTASYNPWGYLAHEPHYNDNGTISPTAALSAMPYTPEESMATLKHFYHTYGDRLWGEFGFRDAFNLDQNWFAMIYVAIDQGPIIVMIENYRSQLCWDTFMANPEISPMLDSIGWTITSIDDKNNNHPSKFKLEQNYPNPFNANTQIRFSLPVTQKVTLEIYNVAGEKVATILANKQLPAGTHTMPVEANQLASGLYFYKLRTADYQSIRKMLLVK